MIIRPWVDGEPVECDGDDDITVADDLGYDLAADSAQCTCTCGEPTGGACEGELEISHTAYIGAGLCWADLETVGFVDANSSVSLSEVGYGEPLAIWTEMIDDPDYFGGSCQYTATTTLPDASYGQHFTLCAGDASDDPCRGDGTCMPTPESPAEAALCIWAPGDLIRPSGWGYAEKTLGYDGVDDTRDCTEGIVQLHYTTPDNAPFNLTSAPDGDCATSPFAWSTLYLASWVGIGPTDDVQCLPEGGEPMGNVAPADPVTVCCHGL